jgi:putative ABC transport system substrate-binding protein
MKRREFIALLGGAAAVWPMTAKAQQPPHLRRIGLLFGLEKSDPEIVNYLGEFLKALRGLGWLDGQNVEVDFRAAPDPEGIRACATELLDLRPDLIVSHPTPATKAIKQATSSLPIVFVSVSDPIGSGFVDSLPHPGGNITGFTNFEVR